MWSLSKNCIFRLDIINTNSNILIKIFQLTLAFPLQLIFNPDSK